LVTEGHITVRESVGKERARRGRSQTISLYASPRWRLGNGGPTRIEWTDSSWNPVTGCTKVSPGCQHCYAERMASRLKAMGQETYRNGFELTFTFGLSAPLRWKKPRTIFVNSMSRSFPRGRAPGFHPAVFAVMQRAHWHRFQILTKRSARLREIATDLTWPPERLDGVSVEAERYLPRIA